MAEGCFHPDVHAADCTGLNFSAKTEREHSKGCLAWQAWDIPDACTCPGSRLVRRCDLCGSRVAKKATECWYCKRHPDRAAAIEDM